MRSTGSVSELTPHALPDAASPAVPAGAGQKGISVKTILSNEEGQATAEYALVIIAAAAVALALIIWATNSSALPSLFEAAVRRVRQFMP